MAVNLGDDADTTGAVYGQLAGAFYGEEGIPDGWRKKIVQGEKYCRLQKNSQKWLARRSKIRSPEAASLQLICRTLEEHPSGVLLFGGPKRPHRGQGGKNISL